MQQGEYLLDGLKILQEVAKSDDVLIIADLAVEKLKRYQTLALMNLHSGDEAYIFGGVCTDGHLNWYDKRVVCREEMIFLGDETNHRRQLPCHYPNCTKKVTVKVDCKGYQ